jgi:hypothetical protein
MKHPYRATSLLFFWMVCLNPFGVYAQWATVTSGSNDTLNQMVFSSSMGELVVDDIATGGYQFKFGVQQPLNQIWSGARIQGNLRYASSSPISLSGVAVNLKKNGILVSNTLTQNQGDFNLGVVDSGLYTLEFVSPMAWRGVNATDALVVMRHFTGIQMVSGIRLNAADVNINGVVNSFDALTINRRVISAITSFPAGNWLYDTESVQVSQGDGVLNLPVQSLCYGDVNGSYFPQNFARQSGEPLMAQGVLNDSEVHPYDWPVFTTTEQSIGAITLDFLIPEGVEVLGVEIDQQRGTEVDETGTGVTPGPGNFLYRREGRLLKLSWYRLTPLKRAVGETLLTLKVVGRPRGMLEVVQGGELADELAEPISGVRLSAPIPSGGDWQAQLVPNPTSDGSQLLLTLPTSGVLDYVVVDAMGRVVTTGRAESNTAGFHKVELMSSEWSSGTYSVRLRWQGTQSTGVRTLRLVKLNR